MIQLELPWPPSVNHYWRLGHNRLYLSAEARRYKAIVAGIVRHAAVAPFQGPLSLGIDAYPPDRRIRDLDNIMKCVCDSCANAGLYANDSQIKHLEAWMREPMVGGKLIICIATLDSKRREPPENSLVPCS